MARWQQQHDGFFLGWRELGMAGVGNSARDYAVAACTANMYDYIEHGISHDYPFHILVPGVYSCCVRTLPW